MKKFVLLILFLISTSNAFAADILTNLQLWIKYDESGGTTIADSSNNADNGTTSGSPTFVAGVVNNALNYSGNGPSASVPNISGINFSASQDFTIGFWLKVPTSQVLTNTTDNPIFEKWDGSAGAYPFTIRVNNSTNSTPNKMIFIRYDGTHVPVVTTSGTVNDNTWHHWIFEKSGSTLSVYKDNVFDSSTSDTTSGTTTNTSPLYMSIRAGGSNYATVTTDELRIYDRALTSADRTALYSYPASGTTSTITFGGTTNVGGTLRI